VVCIALLAGAAAGAPVATDDFEDSARGAINGAAGGAGFTNAWSAGAAQVVAFQTAYTNVEVVTGGGTNAMEIGGNGAPVIMRAFTPETGDTLYFSCYFRTPTADGSAEEDVILFGFNAIKDAPAVSVQHRYNTFAMRVGASNPFTSVTSEVGRVNCVVLKVSKTVPGPANVFNKAELFIDPATVSEPAAASLTLDLSQGISSYSHLTWRTANMEAGDVYAFDMIRIGSTFESVVPLTTLNGTIVVVR
jgi:hypothetical protein